jgi:hypothetical protein
MAKYLVLLAGTNPGKVIGRQVAEGQVIADECGTDRR